MKILMLNIHLGTLQLKRPANIGVIECIEISNLLRKAGHQVDMGSIRDTDVAIDYDKLDVNSYDKILLMNGPVDFPGGAPSSYHQKLFEFLAKSDKSKDIYYILVDLALPFVQALPKLCGQYWVLRQGQAFYPCNNGKIPCNYSQKSGGLEFPQVGNRLSDYLARQHF